VGKKRRFIERSKSRVENGVYERARRDFEREKIDSRRRERGREEGGGREKYISSEYGVLEGRVGREGAYFFL
jgi:hypothetical protein